MPAMKGTMAWSAFWRVLARSKCRRGLVCPVRRAYFTNFNVPVRHDPFHVQVVKCHSILFVVFAACPPGRWGLAEGLK